MEHMVIKTGIIGLFDPASAMGLNSYEKEDYGQTLGSWGVGEGCYVVLPVLGPSTARDAIGSLGNYLGGDAWYNVTVRNDTRYFSDFDYYASKGAGGVDFRAKNFDDINNLEENSIDFYASVKSLYLQDRRKRIINAVDVFHDAKHFYVVQELMTGGELFDAIVKKVGVATHARSSYLRCRCTNVACGRSTTPRPRQRYL